MEWWQTTPVLGATPREPASEEPTWGDYATGVERGANTVMSQGGALLRDVGEGQDSASGVLAETVGRYLQDLGQDWYDQNTKELSPVARARIDAAVDDPAFWSDIGSSIGLKSAGMIGPMAVTILPTLATGGVFGATLAAGAAGGVLSAATVVDDLYRVIDGMSDKELQEQVPPYAKLRATMNEAQARAEYADELQGIKPIVVGAISGITNMAGIGGQVARGLKGGAAIGASGQTMRRRVAKGVGSGAGTEFVEEAAQDVASQLGAVQVGEQARVDYGRAAIAGATGAVVGGALGAGASAAFRGSQNTKAGAEGTTQPQANTSSQPVEVKPAQPSMPTRAAEILTKANPANSNPGASGAPVTPPPTTVPVGNPQSAVTRTGKVNGKKPILKAVNPTVVTNTLDTSVVSDEQQVALAGAAGPVTSEVTAAAVPPAAPPAPAPIAAPTAGPQPAPAPVARAMQNLAQRPPADPVAPIPAAPVSAPTPAPLAVAEAMRATAPVTPSPVTSEVTRPKITPALAEVQAKAGRAPRILESRLADVDGIERARQLEAEAVRARSRALLAEAGESTSNTNWTVAEREARAKTNEGATGIVSRFAPDEAEQNYVGRGDEASAARASIVARAKAMVAEAEAQGIEIPKQIKKAADESMSYNDAVVLLYEARALANKSKPTKANFDRFTQYEEGIRSGRGEEVRAERRIAGDVAKRVSQGNVEERAATSDNAATEEEAAGNEARADQAAEAPASDEPAARGSVFEGKANEKIVGKDDVETKVGGAAKRQVKTFDEKTAEEVASSSARKLDKDSDEFKAIAAAALGEQPPAPKPAPKAEPEPKVAPAVAKVKAHAAAAKKSTPTKVVTSKVTPKVQEVKARVAAAAKKTERKPTEAQKVAGNYPKGKASVQGLTITIETPKGALRTGVDPSGRAWSVKLPAHYGYLNRTEGADGDQVDVYLGGNPKSDVVVIVDQVDADTKVFDEHKVLLGFTNVKQALETYHDGFSDKRGLERQGDVRIMTMAEFKEWLKQDTTKPAGADVDAATAEATIDAAVATNEGWSSVDTSVPRDSVLVTDDLVDKIRERDKARGDRLKAASTQSGPLSKFLAFGESEVRESFQENKNGQILQALYPRMAKTIAAAAGDVQVYVVPDTDWEGSANARASYYAESDAIFIRESTVGDEKLPRIILHEGVHAAFMRAMWESPEISRMIEKLYDTAKAAIAKDGRFADPKFAQQYGLTNHDEFIAEAFSNPDFQRFLSEIDAPPALVTRLKLDARIRNLWDTLVGIIAKATGLSRPQGTLLHAVMRVGSRLELGAAMYDRDPLSDSAYLRKIASVMDLTFASDFQVPEAVNTRLPEALQTPAMQDQASLPKALMLRGLDQIAQLSKDYFGGNSPVRAVADTVEKIRVTAKNLLAQSDPVIAKLHALERKYKGEVWDNFASLLHDETTSQVFADRSLEDNKHLGKEALDSEWAKEQHPALAAAYARLPADLKDARREALAHSQRIQNDMSLGLIQNRVLKALGMDSDTDENRALAVRIHEGNTTDDDKLLLGSLFELIEDAGVLSKVKGPYFPLMRRGGWVVQGTYKIAPPTNALRQMEPNKWEFATRAEAIAFARKQALVPTIRGAWVDKNTGSKFFPDGTRVSSRDTDAEQRFRVTVQDRHVEFFDSNKEARIAAERYRNEPDFATVLDVEPKKYEPGDRRVDMLNSQLQQMLQGLERREGFKEMSSHQQNELRQSITEAGIRMLGSTRIQSRRLQRTYVAGASKDITRNALSYAQSSAGYLARLQHQPELDRALKKMDDSVTTSDYGKNKSAGRRLIANEINARMAKVTAFEDLGAWGSMAQRAMTLSFLSHLVSPAYNLVNSLQPTMVTLPSLAARHGPGRAASAMLKAYDDIGGLSIAKRGMSATGRMARDPNAAPTSFFADVLAGIKDPGERDMFTRLAQVGTIEGDSGLELAPLIETQSGVMGQVDKGLSYLQGIGRQMPRAVEIINRSVSALATYRLELAKTGDHDAAVLAAQEVTNMTQGLYSHTNAPPMFNHPLLRLSLQFKKHGQLFYGLIGHHVGRVMRNENPGDRAESAKALAYIAGAHVLLAGSLGLPTEPVKWMVIAANAAGFTDLTWADVENSHRELAASLFGAAGGEVVTRGVTRALPGGLAMDLSSRVGAADLLSFGEPRSDDPQDLKAYLMDLVLGAPGGLAVDAIAGANHIATGDYSKGIEKLVPIKFASDSIKAYRQMTEGKKTAAGYESMSPYSVAEGVIRGIGFTPAREAETSERRSYFYGAQQRASADRNDLMHQWISATPNERTRLWGQVEKWNYGKDKDQRLTRSELDQYVKRRKSETVTDGFRLTRRDKQLFEGTLGTYNVR